MAYKKKTLRRMQHITRRYARILNDLDSASRRLHNLTQDIGRLELDSTALHNRQKQETPRPPLFAITLEDVLSVAVDKFNTDILTDEQIDTVKKALQFGLECWWDTVAEALRQALPSELEKRIDAADIFYDPALKDVEPEILPGRIHWEKAAEVHVVHDPANDFPKEDACPPTE